MLSSTAAPMSNYASPPNWPLDPNNGKEAFTNYLEQFTALYSQVFTFPKPVVAALNGHTVAGGCMLDIACDIRIMAEGNAKIALNEIGFGSSVFAGSVEMLRFWVGNKTAQEILYSGKLYTAHEAHTIGLVDRLSTTEHLAVDACSAAQKLAEKQQPAFAEIKKLLRGQAFATMKAREASSIAASSQTPESYGVGGRFFAGQCIPIQVGEIQNKPVEGSKFLDGFLPPIFS